MRKLFSAFLIAILVALPTIGAAQVETRSSTDRSRACPHRVDLGELRAVRLNDEGHCVLRFATDDIGVLQAEIFSAPDTTGAISINFRPRGQEEAVVTPGSVQPEGRYEAVLQAVNPGAAVIQLRISVAPPRDPFEPNDVREDAVRVDLPFRGTIHLSDSEPDWFRVDAPRGGVIGVHLRTTYDFQGPRIGFYEADGSEIYVSADHAWGVRGMRYAEATGRPLYIAVWDTGSRGEHPDAYKVLDIVHYEPAGDPASSRSLVALGIEGDDPAFFQLDLIGDAIGVETVAASEADAIARELATAISGRQSSWRVWILLLLILAVAGGVGWYFVLRPRS